MLARLDLRGSTDDLASVLVQPDAGTDDVRDLVRDVIQQVRTGGDAALRELPARFDGVDVDELRVPDDVVKGALAEAPAELREALEEVAGEITPHPERQAGRAPARRSSTSPARSPRTTKRSARPPSISSATASACASSCARSTAPAATCPAAGVCTRRPC